MVERFVETFPDTYELRAWFKKVSGTVAGTARRVLRTTVPDTFLNHAELRGESMEPHDRNAHPPGQPSAYGIKGGPSGGGKPPQPRTAAEIQDWLVNALSRIVSNAPDDIDVTLPFDNLGLDSVSAVGLTGELEEWLGCSVDPMSVYDYPTIEAFSKHLADLSSRPKCSP